MASSNRWLSLAKNLLGPLVKSLLNPSKQQDRRDPGTSQGHGSSPRPSRPSPSPGTRPGGAQQSPARGGSRGGRTQQGGDHGVDAAEAQRRGAGYAGDYRGPLNPRYSPQPDGRPDPGEVVWAWVPYEEDHSQGKDRPVLIIDRNGSRLLALMLTSKDHTREHDPDYLDVGTGAWDRQGRPSEAKLDRVLQLEESSVRREGAVLSQQVFERVADALRRR